MLSRNSLRLHRHQRIHAKIQGTTEIPRISIFLSSKQIYAQMIDDVKGHTLVSASSYDIEKKSAANQELALEVGKLLAEKAKAKKITKAVFDRSGYKYHGKVKALAEGARASGLHF